MTRIVLLLVAAFMWSLVTPATAAYVDAPGHGKNMYKKYNKKRSLKKRMKQMQKPKRSEVGLNDDFVG